MLKKLGVIAIVLGSCTSVLAVGCSSSSDSNGGTTDQDSGGGGSKKDGGGTSNDDGGFGGGDSGGGKKDSGTSTKPDSGDSDSGAAVHLDAGSLDSGTTTTDGGAIPACFTKADAKMLTSSGPLKGQNKCTPAQINANYTACWDAASTTATCDAWIKANGTCDQCIDGVTADGGVGGPSAPYIVVDSAGHAIPNVNGCIAAISGGNAGCKQNFENLEFCADTTCGNTCTTEYGACVSYADRDPSSICVQAFTLDSTCIDALNAVSATDADNKCGASDTTFQAGYVKVATTMCGP